MPTLNCYLLREDGEWFALGSNYQWNVSFGVFPGPPDGSVILTTEDVHVLGLRLDNEFQLAADIIRWAEGKSFRFLTELNIEVPVDGLPSPITGRYQTVRNSTTLETSS